MKKLLLVLILSLTASACNLEVPTQDDLINAALGELDLDKESAMAYTQMAMKQAASAASALKAQTAPTTKKLNVQTSPALRTAYNRVERARRLKTSAVTVEECRTFTELACTESDVCSFTEDYSACGSDFGGKITRTFEGNYSETYKMTIEYDQYQEGTSAGTAYFAFDGKSIMTGTIGEASASLAMNSDGKTGGVFGGVPATINTSSSVTFTYLNGELTVSGTQSGTVEGTEQSTSMSISDLKYNEAECEGPISGTVKTIIGGKESEFVVTACGQATLTIDGEANPITTEELAKTFTPDTGGKKGFSSISEGTSSDSLITGEWFVDKQYERKFLFIYKEGGKVYADYYYETDTNQDGDFYGVGDEFGGGYGTVVIANGTITPTWSFYFEGVYKYNKDDGLHEELTEQTNVTGDALSFSIEGNTKIVIDGTTYTNLSGTGDYEDPTGAEPVSAQSDFVLNGYWERGDGFTESEFWDIYEDTSGFTYFFYSKVTDGTFDDELYTENDSEEWGYGEFVYDDQLGEFTPKWEYRAIDTYDASGFPASTDVQYDAQENGGALETGAVLEYSVSGTTATIGGTDFYDVFGAEPPPEEEPVF